MSIRTENRIPVVVGITGHRSIKKQDETALAGAVRTELKKLQACCPNSPLVMLNSLAEGSDLLCAEIADELGIPLLAALPLLGFPIGYLTGPRSRAMIHGGISSSNKRAQRKKKKAIKARQARTAKKNEII